MNPSSKNWLMKFLPKFLAFMRGRYGQNDFLNKCLNRTALTTLILSLFIFKGPLRIITLLLAIFSSYRFYSKRIYVRSNENQKFLKKTATLRKFFRFYHEAWINRKQYKYFHCKNCQQALRVPRHRGILKVTCSHCHQHFTVKS